MARHGRGFPQSTRILPKGRESLAASNLAIDSPISQTVGSNAAFHYVLGPLTAPGSIAVWDPEVYGEAVYVESLIHPETYGEQNGVLQEGVIAETRFTEVGIDWVVLASRQGDLVIDAAIEDLTPEAVGANLDIDFIIGTAGGAHKDLTFSYVVTKASKVLKRGQDLKLKMKVIGATTAGSSRAISWAITAATTQVGVNLSFNAEVQVEPPVVVVGADLPFDDAISINVRAGADLELDAEVIANSVVGADLDFAAEVELPRPRSSLDFAYEVAQATPFAELPFDAAIASPVGSEVTISGGITGPVDSDLAFDAAIGELVGSELDFDAIVTGTIGTAAGTLIFSYEIEVAGEEEAEEEESRGPGVIVGSNVYDWQADRAREAKRGPYTVGSDLTIDHTILNVVRAAVVLRLEQRALVSTTMGIDAPIAVLLTKDLAIDNERWDMYDQNAAILLEEMDPDLAAMYHARNRAA